MQTNSLEQLCINLANENLQYYFNRHIFKLEQEEYEKEGINWRRIDFSDNQPCLDLITKRPVGILHLLDDETNFPRGSDKGFLQKVVGEHKKNAHFDMPRIQRVPQFGIKHYAGVVTYDVDAFLEKNRDTLRDEMVLLVKKSKAPWISSILDHDTNEGCNSGGGNKARRKPTVAAVLIAN